MDSAFEFDCLGCTTRESDPLSRIAFADLTGKQHLVRYEPLFARDTDPPAAMASPPGDTVYWTPFATPLGTGYAASTTRGLCRLSIPDDSREHFFVWLQRHFSKQHIKPHPEPNIDVVRQMDAYWNGSRTRFELRLDLRGTDFQIAVWESVMQIPYGQTTTYRKLAEAVNLPKGYQAVGAAVGQNPVLVVVPCHRVLGSDGALTGYVAGGNSKQWLLQHEGAMLL